MNGVTIFSGAIIAAIGVTVVFSEWNKGGKLFGAIIFAIGAGLICYGFGLITIMGGN